MREKEAKVELMNKIEESREKVARLVGLFKRNLDEYLKSGSIYNETQLRTDFVDPFFEALGWDIHNRKGLANDLREVVLEATVEVGEEGLTKKPDYEFRLARQRKFFVEAKKPSKNIEIDKDAAFQTRRYGFSAGLPISILTNFYKFVIYDCVPVPDEQEDPRIARLRVYTCDELLSKFDEIYNTISREAVYNGLFDKTYNVEITREGTAQFDSYFLKQVNKWREMLAENICVRNQSISNSTLTFVVQRILNKIIFLRICEDRNLETYETLKNLHPKSAFEEFKTLLRKADEKYNSGLFDLIDDPSGEVKIDNEVLESILTDLYYPNSPYTFSVVETNVLGDIYQLFLAHEIVRVSKSKINIVEKPEVKESGGVVTTPKYIVDVITERALTPLVENKQLPELEKIRVADISCGSGVFLISAFEYLANAYLGWYLKDGPQKHLGNEIIETGNGTWKLSLFRKRQILEKNIFGVDIDDQAVEVARFSLLLKFIEDESNQDITSHLAHHHEKALPSLNKNILCGNSLVDLKRLSKFQKKIPDALLKLINPLTWEDDFSTIMAEGGFDAIIGNPPYIRIQNMVGYSPLEAKYYQSDLSGYSSAQRDNFDKYLLFVEKGFSLLKPNGYLGYIVPNKFFTITSGETLRKIISSKKSLSEIIDFGIQQVFGKDTSNYTCILLLKKSENNRFMYEHVNDLQIWRYKQKNEVIDFPISRLGENRWSFITEEAKQLLERIKLQLSNSLQDVADIFVGVQTSADKIFIIKPSAFNSKTVSFEDANGQKWKIERALLRPSLLDAPLEPFEIPKYNSFIIFPYEVRDGRAEVIKPAVLKKKFPNAWIYLNANKKALAKRDTQKTQNGTWYSYGRTQSLTKFDGSEKIVLPILSREFRYAFDCNDVVVTGGGNGPYYLIRPKADSNVSILFLLAVLNHPISEAYVRASPDVFRGGYYSHGKQFIKDIPIPKLNLSDTAQKGLYNSICESTDQLIKLGEKINRAGTPAQKISFERQHRHLREELVQLVTKFYGLTEQDLGIINTIKVD